MSHPTHAPITLHAITAADHEDWCALYEGYAKFYRQPMTPAILAQAWQWLQEGRLHGALARCGGQAAGLAHWEFILRPLRGVPLAYLHDLYVHSNRRGAGAGRALLLHFRAQAQARGCTTARWLTKGDNLIARALYDQHAQAADEWVMYQQTLDEQ